jgi:hypothetical protein
MTMATEDGSMKAHCNSCGPYRTHKILSEVERDGGRGRFWQPRLLIMFAIALRGGGPYSLDRVIGKEL